MVRLLHLPVQSGEDTPFPKCGTLGKHVVLRQIPGTHFILQEMKHVALWTGHEEVKRPQFNPLFQNRNFAQGRLQFKINNKVKNVKIKTNPYSKKLLRIV